MSLQNVQYASHSSLGNHCTQKNDEEKAKGPQESQEDWSFQIRMQSEVQRSTRSEHRRYMADVVSKYLKENSKRFWSFVKSKKQESSGVAPLINKEGFLQSDPTKKLKFSTSNSSPSTPENTPRTSLTKAQAHSLQ